MGKNLTCLVCGKNIETRGAKKYCSGKCYGKAKMGYAPWNKGLKYDIQMKSRLNMSGLDKGRYKGKDMSTLKGDNNPMRREEVKAKVHSNPNVRLTYFKKGHVPWTRGKKGFHFSPKTEFKEGSNMGENNFNWRGGITPVSLRIRGLKKFSKWRKSVFERDNYTCQLCGKRGRKIQAHHIKRFSKFVELRFEINNGITLCKFCHIEIVTHKEIKWEELLTLLLKQKNKI